MKRKDALAITLSPEEGRAVVRNQDGLAGHAIRYRYGSAWLEN